MLTNILLKYGPLGFVWILLFALVKWIFVWPQSDAGVRVFTAFMGAVFMIHAYSMHAAAAPPVRPGAMELIIAIGVLGIAPILVRCSWLLLRGIFLVFMILFIPDRSEVRAVADVFRGDSCTKNR